MCVYLEHVSEHDVVDVVVAVAVDDVPHVDPQVLWLQHQLLQHKVVAVAVDDVLNVHPRSSGFNIRQ